MSAPRLLLCTDLDRTLLPNGPQPESPPARRLFARLASRPGVILAYVTGRHRALVDHAIAEYGLPQPAFAITDVGSKIHAWQQGAWQELEEWPEAIGGDWRGLGWRDINRLFDDLDALRLQEEVKQNSHKLSYYLPLQIDRRAIQEEMQQRLMREGIRARLVWSIDEPAAIGLLDVLPQQASKLHSLEFLCQHLGFALHEVLFAGDSGNDLEVMASTVPSVLVANAMPEVQQTAREQAIANGCEEALYLARGGYLGMNGNYSAGILEGVTHFRPELASWIEQEQWR